MNNFTRVIDKAIAELVIAKGQPPQYAGTALNQARYHINLALDDARRQARDETEWPPYVTPQQR